MWKSVRQAAWATRMLIWAGGLAFGTYLFITVLLITATGTLAVIGAWMLPEAVLLIRRIAGAKRHQVAAWTGREIPEAYRPIHGTLRDRLRGAVRDPGTLADLRWLGAHYAYGALFLLALPLWPLGLLVDGVRHGLLRREAVVLPWISRLADLDAHWSETLLRPSPKARLAERVEELTATRADAIAAHGAELRRIERDLHDGAQARLVSLSLRIGLAQRAYDRAPDAARELLVDAQDQAEAALTELRHVVRGIHPPILTDRGLAGAVRALAAGSGLDVTVDVRGLEDTDGPRPPPSRPPRTSPSPKHSPTPPSTAAPRAPPSNWSAYAPGCAPSYGTKDWAGRTSREGAVRAVVPGCWGYGVGSRPWTVWSP